MEPSNKKMGHRRLPSDGGGGFKQLTRKDAEKLMLTELQRLKLTAKKDDQDFYNVEFEAFHRLFCRYMSEVGQSINWEKINPLSPQLIRPYDSLPSIPSGSEKDLLNKLVVLKLNGGLGTSMGCTGPKSVICVRNDLTFLDLTIQQIEQLNNKFSCSIPLVLMNSFNTHDDTERVLQKYQNVNVQIYTFMQSKYPRINKESLLPVVDSMSRESDNLEGWYPPGHGDVYRCFKNSKLLDRFIEMGKKWVFISNIDNLGATVDKSILNFLETFGEAGDAPEGHPPQKQCEFLMEVTDKTRADVKGGTLVTYDGKLRLLEIAQVPRDRVDDFTSVHKFKIFNTNNLWISLSGIKRVVEEDTIHMEIIVNPKTMDNGVNVVQLEEAVGAAIKSFEGAMSVNVPRSRFLPVKTTSDLLLVMSSLYELHGGRLSMSPLRSFPSVPLVKLGPHFKKVKDFLARFQSIPDLLELDHLTVSGDVTFGKGNQLKGTVIIIANHGERIDIPSGAILENKIVSGNLRILDH